MRNKAQYLHIVVSLDSNTRSIDLALHSVLITCLVPTWFSRLDWIELCGFDIPI